MAVRPSVALGPRTVSARRLSFLDGNRRTNAVRADGGRRRHPASRRSLLRPDGFRARGEDDSRAARVELEGVARQALSLSLVLDRRARALHRAAWASAA